MFRVLEEATDIVKRHWPRSRGWRVAFMVGFIFIAILGVIAASLYLTGRFLKSLTAGGIRNKDLYLPKMARRR